MFGVSSNTAFLISLVSVLIPTLALYVGWRVYRIERDRRSEEKSAFLVCQFYSNGTRRVLRIVNKGKGEARNIRVLLDNKPITEHPCWFSKQSEITTISGQNHADYFVYLSRLKGIPNIAEVYWDDDIKKNNMKKSSLTL